MKQLTLVGIISVTSRRGNSLPRRTWVWSPAVAKDINNILSYILWQGYLWIIYCIINTIISMNVLSIVLYSTKVASVLDFSRSRSSDTPRRGV